MPRRVLDTNILINHWGDATRGLRVRHLRREHAVRFGRHLANLRDADSILTPIYLEYVCGRGSAHEVALARSYLSVFKIADGANVLPADWVEARRIAERVPHDGLRRQLGDCLIRALCNRLHLELLTAEKRFPY